MNLRKIFLMIFVACNMLSYATLPTPVIHFPMNENAGATSLVNSVSGSTITADATTSGGTMTSGVVDAIRGNVWYINSNYNGFFHVKNSGADYPGATGTAARTYTFWIKPEVIQFNDLLNTNNFIVQMEGGGGIRTGDGTNFTKMYDMYPIVNKWVHVAIVMSAGSTVNNVKMYYNGRLSTPTNTGTNPAINTTSTLLKLFQKYKGWVSDFRYYDQALTQAQVMEVYGYKDLVFHYKFNENTGATAAVDHSYYAWSSTTGGTVTLGHTDATRGQVAKFTIGTLNVTNFKGILGSNPRTLAFWFKQDVANTFTNIMYYGAGNAQFQVQVNASGNIVVYNSYTSPTVQSYLVGVGPYNFSTWRHIAIVTNGSDATQIKIYVDGVEVNSYDRANQQVSTINTQTSSDLKVANSTTGYLSDMRLYAAEMTQSEINSIRNNQWITKVSIGSSTNSGGLPLFPNANIEVSAGTELTLNTNPSVDRVTLLPGAKLTMGANTLTTSSGITLESDATGTATILSNAAVSNVTVKQYVVAGRNSYLSSPLASAAYGVLNRGTSVVEWNEATKSWDNKSSGNLSIGKGYIQVAGAAEGSTGTLNFVGGNTNSGVINVPVTRTESGSSRGFNLVGNPYPSYVNWSSIIVNSFNSNIDKSFWYRTKNTLGGYTFVTYNGTARSYVVSNGTVNTTINDKIPPMQAFWIRVNAGTSSTNLRFVNTMREHRDDNQNLFKAPVLNKRASLRLQLKNETQSDEILIYFDENASGSFDDFDSPKMFNNSSAVPDLYTIANNEKLVINGLNSADFNKEIVLGFGLNKEADLKFSVSEFTGFPEGFKVILCDKINDSQTELQPNAEYYFNTTSPTLNNEGRFSVIFKAPGSTTSTRQDVFNQANVFVNKENKIVMSTPIGSFYEIFSVTGQKIKDGISQSVVQEIDQVFSSGIYIVKLNFNKNQKIKKLWIK
jgi:hypothetical protein